MRVIIVGGSHAGVTAALHLKTANPNIEVTLIEKNIFSSFIASGINLLAKKIIKELEGATLYHKSDILDRGIDIIEQTEVIKLYKKRKVISVIHHDSGQKEDLAYDYLILATGSHQLRLDFGLEDDPRFLSYKNLRESKESYPIIQNAKHVVIIGAGFIGLELADWLKETKRVTLIERMERPLFRYFDDGFLKVILDKNDSNLNMIFNNSITKVTEENEKLQLQLLSGETLRDVDCVVSAINGVPNTEIFKNFINLNFDNTIIVNDYLQTSLPYVYAIGDIISQHLINHNMENNRFFLPLVSNALRSARVAAQNILSNNTLTFTPSNRTIVSLFGPYYLGSSGMNDLDLLTHDLETENFTKIFTKSELGSLDTKNVYTKVKLIYTSKTKTLLGGQIMTTDLALIQNINLVSLMIHANLSIYDIAQMDFFFQPEIKPFQNIIQQIALDVIEKENIEKRRMDF